MSDLHIDSFNKIYTLYYKKSYCFAKSYVQDDLAAEDIASEALIKLWERMKNGDTDERHYLPFLLTVLKNKALDYLKHKEVKQASLASIADWHRQELSLRVSALEACNPDEIFSEEIERIISQTLASLSDVTRRVFMLSRYEDKTNKEIAEIMGLSVKAVEYHISKSLKELRISLKDYLPVFYFLFYYC